ncbi:MULTISPECIES: snapalysin family zinc-dependent metalloprotease [Streptomyces]|uniref:snapalysin family zinc-dependent metalloprotease n=1 Tax=Streptomyces TaxID=1883 RepID=UPI00039ACDCC|nr:MULTISPECIES: snapalysin family zinc-dependent metalloprotease [Streptomyces]MBZ6114078.1 snapalysin family zinc-dependent metalloprotease [Streptomyces olivaceus]MBZ6127959.1 snapalysin family zinc-dependent metalloprotease [Streptomyces olivaceus]MBZ6148702.1 snapalysin family zinc-dependent metalloprotease [Streptomyces olivaceus]MBZ6162532.1 snapalysin family zinc-dependent metalloprotease [Streptomyces olivaceus]MBZ6190422.1 snapalysin family zinc-dependent metalloprotease [Streptomyce
MHVRTLTGSLAATLLMSLPLLSGQAAAAGSPADAAGSPAAARVLTYDASGSAEFRSAVDRGAEIWNESVEGAELRPAAAGQQANIRVLADDGWPRALTTSLGNGTVWIGREAVNEGHNTVRISSHELGHILGLPDRKPGPCSSLMSGASAGTECTNPYPNAAEKTEVEDNFAGAAASPSAVARSAPVLFAG